MIQPHVLESTTRSSKWHQKRPLYVQIVQLFCKTGYFLALNVTAKKNRIIGIVNQSSESSKSRINLTSLPSPRGECNSNVNLSLYWSFCFSLSLKINKIQSFSLFFNILLTSSVITNILYLQQYDCVMLFSNSAFFESQSLGTSIVRLRNLVSGRFLAINAKGRVVTQVRT